MKKIIVLLLTLAVCLSVVACSRTPSDVTGSGNTGANDSQPQITPTTVNTEKTEPTKSTEAEEISPNNWGIPDQFAASNGGPSRSYYINFPDCAGNNYGYGLVADQANNTAVLGSGQNNYAPEINDLAEVFPAYFDHIEFTLQDRYGLRAKNFEFSLEDNAAVVIGDYAMHTFKGSVAFEYSGNPKNFNFIAYATTLKSNGAYAYWVVYDTSDDQANGELIAQHALDMAKTFREEQ